MRIRLPVAATACIITIAACGGHPSDAALEREFTAQRAAFEQVARMATADTALWRISDTWYRTREGENREVPSTLLPAERWAQYRALFRTLELDAGVSIEEGDVILERSASGLGVSGSGKGYRYHRGPMPLTPLCPSLDRPIASDPGSGNGLCFKSLRDGWYLFYSQT